MSANSATPYVLYGSPHSYYTGKARCYLRNQGIDYRELPTAHPDFASRIVPRIGRSIIPVLETPEGEIIQDSVDIIDYFERRGVPYPVYPAGPLQRVLAILIEYYGSQAMLKHAMHYRWSYLEQQRHFLRDAFASGSGVELADKVMGRMHSYLPGLGVHEKSIPLIERSYEGLLDVLEAHFAGYPYLFGGRPSIADYGLIGPLFAHLGRDPVPAQVMKLRAPRVFRWVERMTAPGLDVVEYLESTPEFWADDAIAPTLEPVLAHIADDIFPELTDKLAFLDAWVESRQPADGEPVSDKPHRRHIGTVKTTFRGADIEVGVEPYLVYLLDRATRVLRSVDGAERDRVVEFLAKFRFDRLLLRDRDYTVARGNNIEVWRRR